MPPKSKTFVCDQHASNLSKKLQTFYRDQLLFDISLTTKTDDLKVHAHRAVLSASSDYFLAMLCSTLKEARSDVIELEIDGATLKLIVDFMYSGTIELRSENVERLLRAADVLKMSTLKAACFDFIGETIDDTNCLNIASMAKQQQFAELHKKAFEFALEHFEEVCKTEEFLQLTAEQVRELISSDDLCVNSEETVYQSVMSWVKHDREHREKTMIDLMSHLRFSKSHSERKKPNETKRETVEFVSGNRTDNLKFQTLDSESNKNPERKKPNGTKREILGFVSGQWTDNLKLQTLDPESNKWSCEYIPPPPSSRCNYKAMVIGMKLIIAGGKLNNGGITNIVECMDLQTKEWTNLPPMRKARALPGMAELNGDLYVVGGCPVLNMQMFWLGSVEKYDFRTCQWQELAPMYSGHRQVSVTVLGELLYAGSSSIEYFNPAKNEWNRLPNKIVSLQDFGMAGVGEHLYAVGGLQNGQRSKRIERFNISTNTWAVINASLGIGLSCLRCVSWNNRLIACRGIDDANIAHNSVVEYNPEENVWKTLAPLLEYDLKCFSSSLFTFTK